MRSGAQRTTPSLQLPYRFSVPLLITSGVLHWLCSQSLFVVCIMIGSNDLDDSDYTSTAIEYSPRAVLVVIIIGVVIVMGVILAGRRHYHGIIPVAGSCSSAISAMYHIPQSEKSEDAVTRPLQWGVTNYTDDSENNEALVGHCSFSSREIQTPREGYFYAGISVLKREPYSNVSSSK
jgi:hypothetical protein